MLQLWTDATALVSQGLSHPLVRDPIDTALNQMLQDNGIDSLTIQDLHQLVFSDDTDADYAKQMADL